MDSILTSQELAAINKIIAKIYDSTNMRQLRMDFLKELNALINFSFSDFNMGLITCEGMPKLVDPVVVSKFDKHFEETFIREYENKYYKMDYVSWVFQSPNSIVYRESDLLSEAIRKQNPFYQEYLNEFGLTNISGIALAKDGKFLGAASFYKTARAGDFTNRDLSILELLAPHLERRFDMETKKSISKDKSDSFLLKYNYGITSRELEVMGYLLYGHSYSKIAEKLDIATNTVRKHVANIFSKLEIHSRPQFVNFVLTRNLTYIWDSKIYSDS